MADDIREHVQTSAMRHAHRDAVDAELAGALNQLIEQRNDRLAAFNRKSLLTEELGVQEFLELLSRNQLPKNSFLDFDVDGFGLNKLDANLLAQPELFFFALNVTIFGADLAAVCALQNVEDLAQRSTLSSAQAAGNENAIEVPNRQAVGLDVELGMIEQRHRVQRIDIGHEVPAHAISINQFHHARLSQRVLVHLLLAGEQRIAIHTPTQRRVRDAEVEKNIFVELVFAKQQLMDPREERARFSALADAMMAGA